MAKKRKMRNYEQPAIDEWYMNDPNYNYNHNYNYGDRCFPLGALAIGTIGAFGIASGCRPRRYGGYGGYGGYYGYNNCYPYAGPPIYGCYPYPYY